MTWTGPSFLFDFFLQDAGEVVQVELPAKPPRGPQLPFTPPRPLRSTLLQATFPVSIQTLWNHLMANDSEALVKFHKQLGEQGVSLGPWRQKPGGQRARILRFTTPLSNPVGPKKCSNTETLIATHTTATAFVITVSCTSEGVPFSSCFENHVLWVATAEGPNKTTLHISGECKFTKTVWGPLRGTISSESIKASGLGVHAGTGCECCA